MKNRDLKINQLVIVPLLLTVVLLGVGLTYALFTKTVNPDKEIAVRTGTKYIGIYGEGKNDIQIGSHYTFTIENRGIEDSGYEIYLEHDASNTLSAENITCNITSTSLSLTSPNVQVTANQSVLVVGDLRAGEKDTITIELVGDTSLIYKGKLKIRYVDYRSPDSPKNRSIVGIYTYNDIEGSDNYCVTGEESTCVYSKCYKEMAEGSCPAGTIVKYKVNDKDTVNFHVMFDNGNTMTMQSQKNVLYNVPWINKDDYILAGGLDSEYGSYGNSSKGPLTALLALENATGGWSNVNDQTYSMGTTSLSGKGAQTGCASQNSCTTNTYTLDVRTAKARMITLQEAGALGCTYSESTCPIWMYNYLVERQGGSMAPNIDTKAGNYYWTMNSFLSNQTYAWFIFFTGSVRYNIIKDATNDVRAVVVVNK